MLYHRPRHRLHRSARELFYFFHNPLQRTYNKLFKPETSGVKALMWHKGKLLLVRIGYGPQYWVIPGGKVDRGEEPRHAAERELREETGLESKDLTYFGERFVTREYKRDTVHHFTAESDIEDIYIDDQEIIDAGWFTVDNLPRDRSPSVDEIITMYNEWDQHQSEGSRTSFTPFVKDVVS